MRYKFATGANAQGFSGFFASIPQQSAGTTCFSFILAEIKNAKIYHYEIRHNEETGVQEKTQDYSS